jgi:hypothetical protein
VIAIESIALWRLTCLAAAGAALITSHAGIYQAGKRSERTVWQAQQIVEQQARAAREAEWRAQIDAYEAARRKAEQEAADAINEIRVEYLPGKIEIRKQLVDRPVYRECRVDERVRDILDAALRGRPVLATDGPFAAGGSVLPGGAAGARG